MDIPSFTTDRIILRSPVLGEGSLVSAGLNQSLDDLRPWLAFAQEPATDDIIEKVSATAISAIQSGNYMQWRLWDRKSAEFLGTVDVHSIDASVPRGQIGFWLCRGAVGKGLATEGVGEIVKWLDCERNFKRIEARCDTRNGRAIRTLQNLKFHHEGVSFNEERDVQGFLADACVFAVCPGRDTSTLMKSNL